MTGTATTSGSPSNSPTIYFPLTQRQQVSVGEAAGTRFEWSDFRYLEFGYTYQYNHNVIQSVSATGYSPCRVTSQNSITTCAVGFAANAMSGPLMANYGTYTQQGGYFMGMFTSKFPKALFPDGYSPAWWMRVPVIYQASAYGNFFAYGKATDSSALTRYAFEINNSVQFALPANFTLGPSYALFLFQANAHYLGNSLHRHTVGAQLNYSFDWHTGMSIPATMLGKTQ